MIIKKIIDSKEYESRARQGVPKGVEEAPDLDRPIDFPRTTTARWWKLFSEIAFQRVINVDHRGNNEVI